MIKSFLKLRGSVGEAAISHHIVPPAGYASVGYLSTTATGHRVNHNGEPASPMP